MKKKIIAISREFGSGGRSIGKMVAQRLGFRFFDKELVKEVAARTGISEAVVEEQGEYRYEKLVVLSDVIFRGPKGTQRYASQ